MKPSIDPPACSSTGPHAHLLDHPLESWRRQGYQPLHFYFSIFIRCHAYFHDRAREITHLKSVSVIQSVLQLIHFCFTQAAVAMAHHRLPCLARAAVAMTHQRLAWRSPSPHLTSPHTGSGGHGLSSSGMPDTGSSGKDSSSSVMDDHPHFTQAAVAMDYHHLACLTQAAVARIHHRLSWMITPTSHRQRWPWIIIIWHV